MGASTSSPPRLSQIRRYKANKEVMEKAAEVYTRLKSRVLGPKMEAIQKANKAGPEKDKGDVDKSQEKLAGGETRNEKGEEETNAGNAPCPSLRAVPGSVRACGNLGAPGPGCSSRQRPWGCLQEGQFPPQFPSWSVSELGDCVLRRGAAG